MYRQLMRDFNKHCVDLPIEEMEQQAKATFERRVAEHEDDERRLLKSAIKQAVWFARDRAFSITGLKKLQKEAGTPPKQLQVLRDQVNIRIHVDAIKVPVPKRVGAGGWLSGKLLPVELATLQNHVEQMVKAEKYKKPPPIKVPALEEREAPAYLNKYALQLHEAEEEKMEDKRQQLAHMMADGSFKAFLSSGNKPRGVKAKAAPRRQTAPTARQSAVLEAGAEFEDEGVEWSVLKVQWDDDLDCIIVFYFDTLSVEHAMIDIDDLHEDHEFVEHSSMKEVLEWIGG
jgi:hypothetical protein